MKVIAIIQARMGSTRLPGKVLMKVMGKALLEYQLERIQRTSLIDEIIVATTENQKDDVIVDFCNKLNIKTYRGSEKDVLSRYYDAAIVNKAEIVVRLTSDCPLIDPKLIDKVIKLYLDKQNVDYAANTLKRTFPRGLDTEVFSFQALERTYYQATLSKDREHVTAYMYTNKDLFTLENLASSVDYSHHRWTVDTKEDFELVKRILEILYPVNPTFTMTDVLELLNENPSWHNINTHVEQKKL